MSPSYKTSTQSLLKGCRKASRSRAIRTDLWAIQVCQLCLLKFFWLTCSVLPDDLLNEAIPGNIRKAEHFVAFLKRFVEYIKVSQIQLDISAHCRPTSTSDPNASTACRCRNSSFFPAASERHHLHWAAPPAVCACVDYERFSSSLDCSRFCAERLQSLIRTLELNRLDEYSSLQKVASFATLVATYEKGV